jgi:predicted dehydrogenase
VEVVTMPAAGPDELQMSLRYDDGSLATITYLTNAHRRFPKETFEASRGGRTARLDNFKRTTVWSGARARVRRPLGSPDKGQSAQIDEFLRAVRSGGPMPISLESLATTTRATLAASSAGTGCTTTRL